MVMEKVKRFYCLLLLGILVACSSSKQDDIQVKSLSDTMDGILTRFYAEFSPEVLKKVTPEFILNNITPEEKKALAMKYWYFDVNIPVVVSLMRHERQSTVPFWIEEAGFKKTALKVSNEEYTYEVWQKVFPAGKVELGINGFGNYRTPYFISVGKVEANNPDKLKITNVYPATQDQQPMAKGSHVYTCWRLKVQEFPKELEGDILLSTYRGRPRESHLINALRETQFPSSDRPDQISLTWSGDTKTSIDIQWRTNTPAKNCQVIYWQIGSTDTMNVTPEVKELYDKLLYSDNRVCRYSVQIQGLTPGTTYAYYVQTPEHRSAVKTFKTASEDDRFSFIWFGDTHHSESWGKFIQEVDKAHPEVAFYSIAGDIVSSGLYRNEWDDIFGHTGDVLSRKSLMPVPGNHDNQDGLGNQLYYDLLSYPMNAPEGVDKESTYSFVYKNALFLMIDATQDNHEAHTQWIDDQLKASDASWKFAMFHFPPYNWEEPYLDLQKDWCPLFDHYHVDMVMSGHIHYYMRSKPIYNGEVIDDPTNGTIYVVSCGVPCNHHDITEEPYAAVRDTKSQYYQYVQIEGNTLTYQCINGEGMKIDAFKITK